VIRFIIVGGGYTTGSRCRRRGGGGFRRRGGCWGAVDGRGRRGRGVCGRGRRGGSDRDSIIHTDFQAPTEEITFDGTALVVEIRSATDQQGPIALAGKAVEGFKGTQIG